jgi:hypothetical protein
MELVEFSVKIDNLLDMGFDRPITVHTGGHTWENIVDVVFCQECNQYHIIAEGKL